MTMKKGHTVIAVICLLSTCSLFAQQKTRLSDLVNGNNAFAFDLYAKLKTADGNIFFSPYSISTALAMTYAGAKGNTEKQMMQVLHFGKNEKAFHEAFGELQNRMNEVQKKGNVKLSVANSLWMQKDYTFLPAFLEMTGKNYEAGFNYVDYEHETEKARLEINSWVEKKTNDKIKNLIKQGILNDMTRMVLTNAIYFKGSWATKFDTAQTKEMPFWVTSKDSVKAKMMIMSGLEFDYGEDNQSQFLELPYSGKELSMIIILPKKTNGLKDVETGLTSLEITTVLSHLGRNEVNVFLPRFSTTENFLLNKVLKSMGMKDAFDDNADFSGMTGRTDLYIYAIIHKAFVDVNEEGTEAAAATAVVMDMIGIPEYHKPLVFRADHPFLFLIRDNGTGSILFMGRIVNPLE